MRRLKCYRENSPVKTYVDERNLQIHIQKLPPLKQDQNKAILQKLFSYYQKKQNGEQVSLKKHLNKMEICQELTLIQDNYREMMEVKLLLNSEYKNLFK